MSQFRTMSRRPEAELVLRIAQELTADLYGPARVTTAPVPDLVLVIVRH